MQLISGVRLRTKLDTVDIEEHFRSLAAEFDALKNRVHNLIGGVHWPTHGEWRESILRTVLRRYLPENVRVGRGFIVDGAQTSSQIDILLYDAAAPVLYREQDLVVVTPNAVRGIIEVKSTIRRGSLRRALVKLAKNVEFVGTPPGGQQHRPAVGIFAYDLELDKAGSANWVFSDLQLAVADHPATRFRQLCFGRNFYVQHWSHEPGTWPDPGNYDGWHLYNLRGLGVGYFVSSVITAVAPAYVIENRAVWFPDQSKERYLIGTAPAQAVPPEG